MKYREIIAKIEELKSNMNDLKQALTRLRKDGCYKTSETLINARKDNRYSVILLLQDYARMALELNNLMDGEI